MTFAQLEELMNNSMLSSILCESSFTKTRFLTELIANLDSFIVFLDFDLLVSGYVVSETIMFPNDNVRLVRPTQENFSTVVNEVIEQVAREKTTVVIDSLNVLSNFFNGKDSGRILNAYLMLLASISNHSGSKIFFSSVAKKKDGMWILTPTNRHIVDSRKMLKIFVGTSDKSFDLEVISDNSLKKISIKKYLH